MAKATLGGPLLELRGAGGPFPPPGGPDILRSHPTLQLLSPPLLYLVRLRTIIS